MNKTLTRKLIYVVAALTLLAMLIPAMAVPVSAADPYIKLTLVDPVTGTNTTVDGVDGYAYNITGSIVLATPMNFTPGAWSLLNLTPQAQAAFVGTPGATAMVTGVWGEALIRNTTSENITYAVDKKWGQINHTEITGPGSTYVTWNESDKAWSANATITDTVIGDFITKDGTETHVLQGAILNWYLVAGNAPVDMASGEAPALKAKMAALAKPTHVIITPKDPAYLPYFTSPYYGKTVTGVDGKSTVYLYASGEESVKVVVIPEYPNNPQIPVDPEITTYDFYTTEYEVVPQVRWAGEKIVLEKHFGTTYNGRWVQFALENQSVGALEPILATDRVDHGTVWTQVVNGFASAILTSSDQGQANVVAGLYEAFEGTTLGNQHYFTVFFLKFERVTIGDVNGKRAQHNAGLWNPDSPNPWSTATDMTTQTLNVSQDALVRARVKGWFTNSNPSVRPVRTVDYTNSTLDNPTTGATLTLPAGRWILPDDWATLAGPNWKQSRIHWDIMNTVGGNSTPAGTEFVGAPAVYMSNPAYPANPKAPKMIENVAFATGAGELGNYWLYLGTDYKYKPVPPNPVHTKYDIVGKRYVIGPFSPGLELMTPTGWEIVNAPTWDPNNRNMHTVVPDGYLDWWDAPMPPAKVIYQIQAAGATPNSNIAGYFKAVNKTDIYYVWATNTSWTSFNDDPNDPYDQYVKVYTNPFYQEMIPAHQAIPAFINNGGYDWYSFDSSYGPYIFWEFINQNRYLPIVTSSDPSGHPTCVEVYSDNHGEAMVWLNGDWNLYYTAPINYLNKGAVDAPYQAVVGHTTIQATVDYPYSRLHQAFQSNTDVKTWLWGGLVLGADEHLYANGVSSVTDETRMVISAGTWVGYPGGKTGTPPNESAISKDQVVWIWVADRDYQAGGVLGATVEWIVGNASGSQARISNRTCNTPNDGISQYNTVTKNIFLTNGFLTGTNGVITDGAARLHGLSTLRLPTSYEKQLFNKFWGSVNATSTLNGLDPDKFCVAAIDLEDLIGANSYSRCSVTANIYSNDYNPLFAPPALPVPPTTYVQYITNIDFGVAQPLDDAIRTGDANCDGAINMGDVTTVERMILGLLPVTANVNNPDMGTVVKIERNILGLK